MRNEILLMWVAVTFYAAGSILYVFGAVFSRKLLTPALWVSTAGLVPHAVAIGIRWARDGHPPFLGFYEVVHSLAFAAILLLPLLHWRWKSLDAVGVFVVPIALLMVGGAMLAPKTDNPITPTLASWWLVIHVTFAKFAFSTLLVSFALAVAYLRRQAGSGAGRFDAMLEKLPRQEVVDELIFKFMSVGFIFLTIMIVAGAIWANEAWGRYWGWDPIETWSLITWLMYALALHLRLTMGWKGTRAAWLAIVSLGFVVFVLLGVPIVFQSIHGAYLKGV